MKNLSLSTDCVKVGLVHFCEKFYHLRTDCVKVGLVHFCEKKKKLSLKYRLCADCAKSVGRNLKVSHCCHICNCLPTDTISISVPHLLHETQRRK